MEKIESQRSGNKTNLKEIDYFLDLCTAWIEELKFRTKHSKTEFEKKNNENKTKQFRKFKNILLKIEYDILNNNTSETFLNLVEKYDSKLELIDFIEDEQEKIEEGRSTLDFLRKRKKNRGKKIENTKTKEDIKKLKENLDLLDFVEKNLVDIHTSVYISGGFTTNGDLGYIDDISGDIDKMENEEIFELVRLEKITKDVKIPIEKERKKFFGFKKEKYIEYEYAGKEDVKFSHFNGSYKKDDVAYKLSYIYADPDYKDYSGRKGNILVINITLPEKDTKLIKDNLNNINFFREISKLSFFRIMKKHFKLSDEEIETLWNKGGEQNNNIPVKPQYNGNTFLKEINL